MSLNTKKEQLWLILESTQEGLDELCVLCLERGHLKNHKVAMEESQALETEISEDGLEKAHKEISSSFTYVNKCL